MMQLLVTSPQPALEIVAHRYLRYSVKYRKNSVAKTLEKTKNEENRRRMKDLKSKMRENRRFPEMRA